jgi:hypothetical protein
MPISPSDLPWWGWLLCSIAAWIVVAIASVLSRKRRRGCYAALIAAIAGLVGLVTGLIAVFRFIKWV